MTNTSQINIQFAVSKALEAVKSWEKALLEQTAAGDLEGIAFCQKSLKGCRANLEAVKESANRVHEWL